jgi:hypothetical protein
VYDRDDLEALLADPIENPIRMFKDLAQRLVAVLRHLGT